MIRRRLVRSSPDARSTKPATRCSSSFEVPEQQHAEIATRRQRDDRPRRVKPSTEPLDSDIGPYGASDIRTPHLDRLALEGIRLTVA